MNPHIERVKPGQSRRFSVYVEVLGVAAATPPMLTLQCLEVGAVDLPIVDAAPVDGGVVPYQGGTAHWYYSDQVIPFTATPGRWARRWRASGVPVASNALTETELIVDDLDF